MKDTLKHQGLREQLINTLIAKGIQDPMVITAMRKVPRHLFLDPVFESHAYQDKAFPIAANQTISHPYTVAIQTQLLAVQPGDKILEVGTGSGYQCAVLVQMKAHVYSIERQKELFDSTKRLLPKLGYYPKYLSFGDGYKGLPAFGPFDKIIVTAGASHLPKALLLQLKINGRMVIPVGDDIQSMHVITRLSEKEFKKIEVGNFKFVPMLNDKNSEY